MKVYGKIISDDAIAAALSAMTGTFTAADIELALEKAGLTFYDCPSRVADRLLQRERKAGRIAVDLSNKRKWIAA